MKKLLTIFLLFVAVAAAYSQNTLPAALRPDKNTIVKDSTGMVYPYAAWQKMLASGEYNMRVSGHGNDKPQYTILKLSDAEIDATHDKMPRPQKSDTFANGDKLTSFSANDLDGNKFKLKDLQGKVVVLNFWFIGCPPCRAEIPQLNDLAVKYANDPDVVFIAIALDGGSDVKQFVKANPFGYHLISDGKDYADLYKVHLYPTNLVLDKAGKVVFNSVGYSAATPYWINRSIKESKQKAL